MYDMVYSFGTLTVRTNIDRLEIDHLSRNSVVAGVVSGISRYRTIPWCIHTAFPNFNIILGEEFRLKSADSFIRTLRFWFQGFASNDSKKPGGEFIVASK